MRTLVIQSCSEQQRQGWQQTCLRSVAGWAQQQGYDYRFVGDEIFAKVPAWYLAKVGNKLPVATDYGRLVLLQAALAEGYEQVCWLDADVLVLSPEWTLSFTGSCAFGLEHWVQPHKQQLTVKKNLHNAALVFRQGCAVLPFLLRCVASLMQRVDPQHIAPQFVGPKLLQALHPFADFAVLPAVGALSPLVIDDVCNGGGPALRLFCQHAQPLPQAVNLCASLLSASQAQRVIEQLQSVGLSSG
jgi:hypothetical protein